MDAIGALSWVVAGARLPVEHYQEAGLMPRRVDQQGRDRACVLNTGQEDAEVTIELFFGDRASLGPYRVVVPTRQMRYINFADLAGNLPASGDVDFCAVLTSGRPIVVQHVQVNVHGDSVTTVSSLAYAGSPELSRQV